MSESRLFKGLICLTEINKEDGAIFTSKETGKMYINVDVWLNSEPDKYGNNMSIQHTYKKSDEEGFDKNYIANLKEVSFEKKELPAATQQEVDNLPF